MFSTLRTVSTFLFKEGGESLPLVLYKTKAGPQTTYFYFEVSVAGHWPR